MNKLKSCPFCKGKAKIVDGYSDAGCWVECIKCGACGPRGEMHDEITKLWNKRYKS